MKKLAFVLMLVLASNAANANMTEWEQHCSSEAFIAQEIQMLRTTVYLDQAQAIKEVMQYLKAGEYKKYGISFKPDDVPYVADIVFYEFDKSIHHLDAGHRYYEFCVSAEAGEGDECDGC